MLNKAAAFPLDKSDNDRECTINGTLEWGKILLPTLIDKERTSVLM